MTDPTGTTTYSYTNRDQVLSKATPQGALGYTYDLSSNVASVLSSNANGTSVVYAWDADNRLSSVTDSRTNGVTNYSYDQTSQLASMQYPNTVAHAFTYDDDRDRPISLNVTGPLGTQMNYTQTFGPSSHKLSVAEQSGRDTNYGYDSIYRLASESIAGDPTASNNGALTYSLDPVGNRLSLASTLAALTPQTFAYDPDDRISGDAFDANGNALTSGENTLAYDFENHLTQFDASVQMTYDGDGNRIVRTQGGSTTRYLVDDLTPAGHTQVAEEVVNGAIVAQFTYGSWRISQNRAGAANFYGYDAGRSVRELFSDTGAVTDTYAYDAFGNTVAQSGSTVNEFPYRGEQLDSTLGAYYLRARYDNPLAGRFMSRDPNEGDITNPATLHAYLYAGGDPVNRIDPTGRGWLENVLLKGITSDLLLNTFLGLGENMDLVDAIFCTNLAALWAVENPNATVLEIVAYESACLATLGL